MYLLYQDATFKGTTENKNEYCYIKYSKNSVIFKKNMYQKYRVSFNQA